MSAGITAGTRNSFGFQGTQVPVTGADIYFSDRLSDNSSTFPFGYVSAGANPATARYALCARSQGGIASWFMQVLQGFLGQPVTPSVVGAWATATQMSAQVSCALPIGLCKLPAPAPQPIPSPEWRLANGSQASFPERHRELRLGRLYPRVVARTSSRTSSRARDNATCPLREPSR